MAHTRRTLKLTTESRNVVADRNLGFRSLYNVRASQNIRGVTIEELYFPAWDLTLDASGRIAIADGALSTAQAVANEARLFVDDAYFIQDRGIPHFAIDLGQKNNGAILRSYLNRAAISVDDVREVINIEVETIDRESRTLTGKIEFKTIGDDNGTITTHF